MNPESRAPTIRDVAVRAGVSKSLVSLALRGSSKVSPQKRDAVLTAASDLGYRANGLARRLVSGRTHTLGVVVTDLHNPFYAEVLDGIHAAAGAAGYRVLIGSGEHPAEAIEMAELLLELRFEGLLFIGSEISDSELEEIGRHSPAVLVGAGPGLDCAFVDTVVNDDHLGACLAVEHLAELGHRHIAHLAAGTAPAGRERRRGYEEAMAKLGFARYIGVFGADMTEQGGRQAARAALEADPRITAMFVVNDLAAVGAYDAVEEAELAIPSQMSLVGYDDTFLAATHHLSLTTVSQPRREMGKLAVRTLLQRVTRGRRRPQRHVLPPKLVVRSSTARPRRARNVRQVRLAGSGPLSGAARPALRPGC